MVSNIISATGRQLSLTLLDDIPSLLDVIMILRCLNLRQRPDDEWFKLNQLQSSADDDLKDPDLDEARNHIIALIEDNFAHLDTDNDMLARLYGILNINAFEIPNAGEGKYILHTYS